MPYVPPAARQRWFHLAVAVAIAACATFAREARNTGNPLTDLPARDIPLPALAAYATAHGLATDGIEIDALHSPSVPGDTVSVLVSLRAGKATKQWLVHLEVASATEKELRDAQSASFTMETESGRKHRFTAKPTFALDIRSIGPFAAGMKAPAGEKRARAMLSPEYLALGLDKAARAFIALQDSKPGEGEPPRTLSETEERGVVGMLPALFAFFQAVQTTPGLSDILWEVLEKPSVWSVLKHGGKIDLDFKMGERVTEISPEAWSWTGPALYQLDYDLSIYKQLGLRCRFLATEPRPPLLTTAGIVGLLAQSPRHPDRRLDLRVVAARRGQATPATRTESGSVERK